MKEFSDSRNRVNNTMKCYEEFGAIKDKFDRLRCIIETLMVDQLLVTLRLNSFKLKLLI